MSSKAAASLLSALLVLSLFIPLAAAVPDARLTVSDVTVTPDTPVTDAPVTMSVTVSNGAGSPEAIAIDEIRVIEDGDVIARSLEPGSLSPGGTVTVPLTARFSEAGQHDINILVRGRDADNERVEVRRSLSLVVERAPPLVEMQTTELVTDTETNTPVVVSNPTTEPIRNVVVSLSTGNGEVVVDRRTVATLAAGAAQPLNFTVRPADAGTATLGVEVAYTTASGTRATETYDHEVTVDALEDDVGVRVESVAQAEQQQQQQPGGQLGVLLGNAGGGETTRDGDSGEEPSRVVVTVSNFGNAPLSDVVATPRMGETTLARVSVPGPIEPGEEETVVVALERAPAGSLTVDVDYDVGVRASTATGQFDFRPRTGEIRLTGVDLSVEDGEVTLTGNAGNVGRGSVTGLVVAIGDAEGVRPAYPQRDYFIGTVEGSEFAPFELTARADGNATVVPVVISYAVDGDVREERFELPLRDDGEEGQQNRQSPLPLWLGVVGLAIIGATAVIVRGR